MMTTGQFEKLFDDRLRKVYEAPFSELPDPMIEKLFNIIKTDKLWEEFYSVGAIPNIPQFEGSLTPLDISPGYHIKVEPLEFAGKLQFERKLMDGKRYDVFNSSAKGLGDAAANTREDWGVRAFGNADSVAFDFQTSEEGLSTANNSHTTKSGVSTTTGFDNLGTTALSKTALATSRIAMKSFKNDIGHRYNMPEKFGLIVPLEQEEMAWEINTTKDGLHSGEGTENFHKGRYEIIVYPRLSDYSTNNWVLVNLPLMKEHLKWIERISHKGEFKTHIDFNTMVSEISTYLSFGYGNTDWRWGYFSFVD